MLTSINNDFILRQVTRESHIDSRIRSVKTSGKCTTRGSLSWKTTVATWCVQMCWRKIKQKHIPLNPGWIIRIFVFLVVIHGNSIFMIQTARCFVTAHGGSNLANGFAIIKTAHNRTQIKPQTLGSSSCTALTISLSQMKAVISVARSSIHCCGGHPSTVSLMAYLSSKRIFPTLDLQIEGAKADTKFSGKACKKDKIRQFTASSSDPSTFVDCQAYQSADHQRQCCSAQSFWTLWTAWMVQWPVKSSTHVGSVSSAVRSFKTEVSNVNPMCCPSTGQRRKIERGNDTKSTKIMLLDVSTMLILRKVTHY